MLHGRIEVKHRMDTLVTTDWLSRHLDDPDLVVLDCTVYQQPLEGGGFRNVSGRGEYERGPLSKAGFADLKRNLVDNSSPIDFAVPTPAQFCAALDIGDDSRVVLYDVLYTAWAARVWWMLRAGWAAIVRRCSRANSVSGPPRGGRFPTGL